MRGVDNLRVENCEVKDFWGFGGIYNAAGTCVLIGNRVTGSKKTTASYGTGIYFTAVGGYYAYIAGNYSKDNEGSGIIIEDNAAMSTITGNTSINDGRNGIWVESKGKNTRITDNHVFGADSIGIEINGNETVLVDNTVDGTVNNEGIRVTSCENCIIESNTVKNNNAQGIRIIDSINTIIANNRCTDTQNSKEQTYGIQIEGVSNYCTITGNDVTGNLTGGMSIVGSNNIIRDNVGWMTENGGTGTINSGGTTATITHSLAQAPSARDISIIGKENPTSDIGNIWVGTINNSQFTVNVRNDPGASNWDFGWKATIL
jgi:parallel beta-helix repeat protein